MNEFFTWDFFLTFAGATAAVTVVTQFLKFLLGDKLHDNITRLASFIVALVILELAALFTGTLTASVAVISVFNAMAVTLTANGGFDLVKSLRKES